VGIWLTGLREGKCFSECCYLGPLVVSFQDNDGLGALFVFGIFRLDLMLMLAESGSLCPS
jgi:hypothetical protein